MKAYKGFDKNMKCRDFQYKEGKTYKTDGAKLCEQGFHACEYPLDCLSYYLPGTGSVYHEVELSGHIDKQSYGDTKVAAEEIKIGERMSIAGLVKASIDFIMSRVKSTAKKGDARSAATNTGCYSAAMNTGDYSAAMNTGDYSAAMNTGDHSAAMNTGAYSAASATGCYSAATNTGDRSAATNTGNYSAATNAGNGSTATNTGDCSAALATGDSSAALATGYCSAAEVSKKHSVAIVTGRGSKARGVIGCWIVLTERDANCDIIGIKAVRIDGKKYQPDTWYTLRKGKVVKVEEEAYEFAEESLRYYGTDWELHNKLCDMLKPALSAPVRNCERFKTKEEAAIAFAKEKKQWIPQQVLWELAPWLDWLFAPSTERKGEINGSK